MQRDRTYAPYALIGWAAKHTSAESRTAPPASTEPGLVFHGSDGRALRVAAFEIADGVVVAVRSVLNPDKLTHIPGR